ncbi:DUF5302 domain-containing protein [Flindersiella endophytica]
MSSDPTEPKAGEEQGDQEATQVDQAEQGEQAAEPAGDLKSRFRDALNRKQAHSDGGAPKALGEPKVHEVHSSSTRKRQFRRKSG